MSFFRRGDDKPESRISHETRSRAAEPAPRTTFTDMPVQDKTPDVGDYQALGAAMEVHKQSSGALLSGLSALQTGMSSLIEDHARSMQ